MERYAAAGQDGHLFVGLQGGQLRRSNFRDDWVKAKKAAGVSAELHFHDLRHTGKHAGLHGRGQHAGTDDAHGPQQLARRAALSAHDQRPGQSHRRSTGRHDP
ncbi:tyrosine-type recombinase/integrase [Streptomyces sp. NPDC088387]|uniref:tyrosine-type recombinase/integrase n=1 Tax=Streptomyces sp. NPDC088387 TaxID=3365859 RepID=UPI00380A2483